MVALTSSVPPRRFGFHQPPFNSVDHLHLHCFALSFLPRYLNIFSYFPCYKKKKKKKILLLPHGPKLQIIFFYMKMWQQNRWKAVKYKSLGPFWWFYWSRDIAGQHKASSLKGVTEEPTHLLHCLVLLFLPKKTVLLYSIFCSFVGKSVMECQSIIVDYIC